MVATDALIPIQRFLPLPREDNRFQVTFKDAPEEFQGGWVFESSPPDPTSLYGPDGTEITLQKTGRLISHYA
ncbi:MAG: hypothetical protein ACLFUT_10170 [Desulfobacteraceae bacterium]